MITRTNIEDIISKLTSDKTKIREEGVNLLLGWLEGTERSISFCQHFGRETAQLTPNKIPHAETWPYLLKVLMKCIASEILACKKKPPKLNFAKVLRISVEKAEEGKMLFLLSVVKSLFNHIWDVLKAVPTFQSEYTKILQHLLGVDEYRFHMRKKVYCGLVCLHLDKLSSCLEGVTDKWKPKEIFRTLHSLLENPPGDFPDIIREDVVSGFKSISALLSNDDGDALQTFIECVNLYLLKDGTNLDREAIEIHSAVHELVFRCWITTKKQKMKDAVIMYARLQLKLIRDAADGGNLIEQILDVVSKDLDQSVATTNMWNDDKHGNLSSSQSGLMELAAYVFYQACITTTKAPSLEKRQRREPAASRLRQGLMNGKWLWNCAFCFLVRNYYPRICQDLMIYWFQGICESFDRILSEGVSIRKIPNDGKSGNAYDGLLWVLRSLQELSSMRLRPISGAKTSHSSATMNQLTGGWLTIWNSLIHALPIFSNLTLVADAALLLLANIISKELISIPIIPQDFWDLRLFKRKPSMSALYFIVCYFTKKGSQGDVREVLHIRRDLLRATLGVLDWEESIVLNEHVIIMLPAAMFSLCFGCSLFPHYQHNWFDHSEVVEDQTKSKEDEHDILYELFDFSVKVLAESGEDSSIKATPSDCQPIVRLPPQIRDPLESELENYFIACSVDNMINTMLLPDILFLCALFCNCIYGSISTRFEEKNSTFHTNLCQHVLKLFERAVCIIEEAQNNFESRGWGGSYSFLDGTGSILVAVRGLVRCPLLSHLKYTAFLDDACCRDILQVIERFLDSLANLFKKCSDETRNVQFEMLEWDPFTSVSGEHNFVPSDNNANRIVDVDFDMNDGSMATSALPTKRKSVAGTSVDSVKWKLDIIAVFASFFTVLPVMTWEILFDLIRKENDLKVCDTLLLRLCEHFTPSSASLSNLVTLINDMIEVRVSLNLRCASILIAIRDLLKALISINAGEKDNNCIMFLQKISSEQSIASIGDLLNKIADVDVLDWSGRVVLADCICNLLILDPQTGQTMIEKLLRMLQDTDWRVRLFLAKRVGLLFQLWEGHDELFLDICSNMGVKLVMASKEKLVTAAEVLRSGSHARPILETVIVTLEHLAFCSEKIEVEAVFMICAIAAVNPSERELIQVILDNLSSRLHYSTRSKYLEEFIGKILFSWVACDISLASLVEVRDIFIFGCKECYFVQYCCPWLLPALILDGNTRNLTLVSKIAGQRLADLVRTHFVPIFAVCMALHSSKKPGKEKAVMVLQNSLLHIADMSENERDCFIKQHMVSIVSFILSLSSSAADPASPLFSRDVILLAVQTVVDGFIEMDDRPTNVGIVDKINIFRADRIFMFIVEMHYKLTSAVHHRHTCHRLSGVEVLVNIIGHRAAASSTSSYLFNLVGQFIGCHALQEQCCLILFKLLEAFDNNPTKDTINVLGEQLQFLVSKLVACCIPPESSGEIASSPSSQVVSLLYKLTVDSDPSLYDYIRELEPFPDIDCFSRIRMFHEELCKAYSPRDHFLKFVRRSSHLPQRLLFWSLQTLHKKLLQGEIFRPVKNVHCTVEQFENWQCEPEIVSAVWMLVSMCGSNDANNIRGLVSDFISRVGIGDPHCVVFHLPGEVSQIPLSQSTDVSSNDVGIPDELLIALIRLLKKYLLDDSVSIIDMTSRALQGILSTERGQKALLSFDSYERSLIAIHSKGVNMELVEKMLSERKVNAEATSMKNSSLWTTDGKTYEMWICPIVFSLIDYSNDTILRLCQDIVLLKAEVAELLFPNVLYNIAGRKDLSGNLCETISSQVQENVLTDANELIKSVQVMLNAMNELRLHHVMEREVASSSSVKRDTSKNDKPSSYSSRSRSASKKSVNLSATSSTTLISASSWKKVYWLSIDYLLVAKSAIHCGSYFTSVMYVEYWCEEHFNNLTLGNPDFSPLETLQTHIDILTSAVTQINEPDSLYGIIQSHKLTSQIITYEHEGNWGKALEYYDLRVRSEHEIPMDGYGGDSSEGQSAGSLQVSHSKSIDEMGYRKSYKGLIRSLQQTGCTHVLDLYCQGLTSQKGQFQQDSEFTELQYEAAWRAGNWDFSLLMGDSESLPSGGHIKSNHFNEKLHGCLRALQEGDSDAFHIKLIDTKQELVLSIHHASKESTEYIYSSIMKLQILDHLGMAWDLRWKSSLNEKTGSLLGKKMFSEPITPTIDQLELLNTDWSFILKQTQLHMNLLEPFIAFRRSLLQILNCKDGIVQNLLESASTLRKGSRFSLASAALHEFKIVTVGAERQLPTPYICFLGRIEEAKLLRAQGQYEMAINLAKYIIHHYQLDGEASNLYRLVGKWLAETRSSNSRTILEQYLKHAVGLAKRNKTADGKCIARQCQTHFHLAHYADALFRSYEERLNSNEWQAALRLRKHKTKELEALIKRLKTSTKAKKTDYSVKIQELQKQLSMDREEADKLQDDRDNFLSLALEGYQRCLVIGDKYDVRVVFRLVSLWFSLSSRQDVVNGMLNAVKEVQSYKFIPLVYQIASRMGNLKDSQGPQNFQYALISLVKKMSIDHPYHTIFQLLALANGDRVKDKQRSRNSFVVDMDKKLAAESLLNELSSYHGPIIRQMRQMVEIYIKLAELETKREDTNRKIPLPREIRSVRQLELVPVVTATFPVDSSCQYYQGSFPHFKGLGDSIMVMNGINAPKVVECLGSDGQKYRQLAKSGNDDLRQDAVMEQFFGLVNTFLQNHRDTRTRRIGIRTYKVVPFTPSAGVLEWVNGTLPLGEYLLGSLRNGGAHGRYGVSDWSFLKCREEMANAKDKRKTYQKVCENFRPVMHYFFLEKFFQPANWFERRLFYTRSVAASSMVGYIVGLGDRHSMNILIDQVTAEVVHIDLGVAFEQGLMLKTPERVPFRLTRDIIDGMGVTGVEGVFRRCCEETLSVMRTNKEALLTIIEVFIHDPLYKWALSPLKALQIQKEGDDEDVDGLEDSGGVYEGNKDAARALMRVKQKLDGYEEGEMRSVHGQVQQLIQDAIDPDRLCQMFPGWGAWL
ncbi:non-specific serine/threonine protein kinase [Ranunculus cassubicifolius]